MAAERLPDRFRDEEHLEEFMSEPPPDLVEMMKRLDGDLAILGIGGKMGVTLGREAVRAAKAAGVKKRILGVSRFSDEDARRKLEAWGLETLACDLLDREAVARLPACPNVIFMAGRKFGTTGDSSLTWAMNTLVPGHVAEHYRESRIVAFSTGNVYPLMPVKSGGATEGTPTEPVGEYAQSTLGREKIFSHFSLRNGTPVAIIRLNYAIDMRYGVLYEIARKVWSGAPVDLSMGHANVIWQGDANTQALLALEHCASPANLLNVTGPETLSVRFAAEAFGRLFDKPPRLEGQERDTALLNNASKAAKLFGYPRVPLLKMIEWVADWVKSGGRDIGKPSHFETRDGKF
ncbi:MAG: NAD(P)-dependent oxidoreductase [Planctomycetota bacterium]|nr:NAD(P)-dependent oxidoreductase [Planctomycetota bacterium]